MVTKYLSFFCLLFVGHNLVYGQESVPVSKINTWDSLSQYYIKSGNVVQSKLYTDSIADYANYIAETDPQIARVIFERVISKTLSETEKLAYLADFAESLEYSGASKVMKKIIELGLEISYNEERAEDLIYLYKLQIKDYKLRAKYDSALAVATNFMEFGKNHPSKKAEITALMEYGSIYSALSDYFPSVDYYTKALAKSIEYGMTKEQITCYTNLGIIYNEMDQSTDAISFNRKALLLLEKDSIYIQVAQVANNIGLAYNGNNQPDSAKYFIELGLEASIKAKSKFGENLSTLNLGLVYFKNKEYDKSLKLFEKVLLFFESINDNYGKTMCHFNLCRIYLVQGKLDLALENGKIAYELAESNSITRMESQVANKLSEIYERGKDYKMALNYHKRYEVLKDSLFNREKTLDIGRAEAKLNMEKATLQNDILKSKQSNQDQKINIYTFVVIIAGVFLLVTLFLLWLYKRANKKLKDSNKIVANQSVRLKENEEAKSRFFANISHDFRSPLTLIKGSLTTLRAEENYLTEKSEQSVDSIDKNVRQLTMLTDEINNLVLLEDGKFELRFSVLYIDKLVAQCVGMFHSMAQVKNIEMHLDVDLSENTVIHADTHNLERILYNLIGNAIKFSEPETYINVSLSQKANKIELKVADQGKGINEDDLTMVFDRFFQAKSNEYKTQEGLGIGLSLTKELVEMHNGSITVDSQLGKGTVFTVLLPYNLNIPVEEVVNDISYLSEKIQSSPQAEHNTSGSIVKSVDFGTKGKYIDTTIMVVDDHPDVRAYIVSVIGKQYYIIQAKNGLEAYEIMQKQKIDLVVTDLMMPWMDGFELIEKIKGNNQLKNTKIMVVSARTTEKDKLKVLDQGVNEFLSKPFDEYELNKRIDNLLSTSDMTSEWTKLADEKGKLSDIERNLLKKINVLVLEKIDDSKFSVLDLAGELAASERSTNRILKKLTGLPPKSYIQAVRMDYAETLLKEGKVKSMLEAARSIGISNSTEFTRQFRKVKGYDASEIISS